jgi:hypothetical protein
VQEQSNGHNTLEIVKPSASTLMQRSLSEQGRAAPKDVSMTHPYTHKLATAEIQKRLGTETRFTTYDLQVVLHVEKIKNPDPSPLHYLMKQTGTHCYPEALIDAVAKKIHNDPTYLTRTRDSYRKRG